MGCVGIYGLHLSDNIIRYVGQSNDMHARLYGHRRYAIDDRSSHLPVARWMRKHGTENVHLTVLQECEQDALNALEVFWIAALGTHVSMNGYNCTFGGGGLRGWHHTEEAKDKMRRAAWGSVRGPLSDETKAKISERLRNNTSESFKQGRSLGGTRGNHNRYHVARGIVNPKCIHCNE